MNYRKSIIELLGVTLLVGAVATSCYDYAETPLVKLAAFESEIVLEAGKGTFEMNFYANSSSFHVEYLNEADWLVVTTTKPVDGVAVLTGECTRNDGFKRRVDMVLCSDLDSRRDTVVVKQKSFNDAFLEFDDASVIVAGAGGTTTSTIHTNVSFDDMDVEIMYTDTNNADWVADFYVLDSEEEDRPLRIVTYENTDEDNPRTALAKLSFVDGWGETVMVSFTILQCNAKEEAGREITFEEFRSEYATGAAVEDYIILDGIVVSNTEQGNAGQPEQTTSNAVDYTPTTTTVYLESEDGKYGILCRTATEDDNIFEQFDHVSLLLHGAVGTLLEESSDAPACYEITGLERTMVLSRTSGTVNDIPVKERAMNELTDDDLYTYVTLVNVEIPIRKGALFAVDGGYYVAAGTSSNRMAEWPLLIRDINGGSMYMLTNSTCLYHRDGTRLPYGSGSLKGVLVHEHFSHYEWATGADPADIYTNESLANIGRYSLRHQTKDDVWGDMNDDFEDGFSAFLCEYRYFVVSDSNVVPSYGTNGWLTHTYQTAYTTTSSKNYSGTSHFATPAVSHDYLGPVGRSTDYMYGINYGNKNGLGMIIDESKENMSYLPDRFAYNREGKMEFACEFAENSYCGYGAQGWSEEVSATTNAGDSTSPSNYQYSPNCHTQAVNYGKGYVQNRAWVAFYNHYWWDDDYDRPYGYLVKVSTAGISSTVASLQLAMRPITQTWYTPNYWSVEWSLTDEQWDSTHWYLCGEFTMPDTANSSAGTIWQLPASKPVNVPLPTDIFGHDEVYIRIRPTNDICGSGIEWGDSHLKDSPNGKAEYEEHGIQMTYLAIRYNK